MRHGVLLTGGTGFLEPPIGATGTSWAAVRVVSLESGHWERVKGVEYVTADLAQPLPAMLFSRTTRRGDSAARRNHGGWEQHQINSIDATEH